MVKERSILLVDDDLDVLRLSVKMIKDFNSDYSVMVANTAEKGIEIAKDRIPDIIITDWYMPDHTGIYLIKELKKIDTTQDIPVIMTTGVRLSPEDLAIALEAGAIDYIRKPISEVELQARVNAALLLSKSWQDALIAKDKELNERTEHLNQNVEFLRNVQHCLTQLNETKTTFEKVLSTLDDELSTYFEKNSWVPVATPFRSSEVDFNKKLLDRFPGLSPKDLKLCALVMTGMSIKDIASTLSISEDSAKVSRYRLRKKLSLGKEENLQNFLTYL